MTDMEKRLARRIHKQRLRLRELEKFSTMQRESRIWTRSRWLHMASKLLRENDALRARLEISERFDQRAALADLTP